MSEWLELVGRFQANPLMGYLYICILLCGIKPFVLLLEGDQLRFCERQPHVHCALNLTFGE